MLRRTSATRNSGLAVGLLLLLTGCGGNSTTAPETTQAGAQDAAALPSVTTVPPSAAEPIPSPALAVHGDLPVDAGPDEVCRKFLECLKQSERSAAEKLLSKRALTHTKRANLNLESPGSETAEFIVEPPRFATNKKELATVDCLVRDSLHGQAIESKLSWMLRLEPAGWRICGMILEMEDSHSMDLLSFENPLDVERIKATLSAEENPDVEMAQRQSEETQRK